MGQRQRQSRDLEETPCLPKHNNGTCSSVRPRRLRSRPLSLGSAWLITAGLICLTPYQALPCHALQALCIQHQCHGWYAVPTHLQCPMDVLQSVLSATQVWASPVGCSSRLKTEEVKQKPVIVQSRFADHLCNWQGPAPCWGCCERVLCCGDV